MRVKLQGKYANGKYALVDDCDFEKISGFTWRLSKAGYVYTYSKNKMFYLHRVIAETPKGKSTDHSNMDKLDNRRSNLRICSHSQNTANTLPRFGRRLKGAYYDKTRKNYLALISVKGKSKNLGRYKTEEEAHKAYAQAAMVVFGEFARFTK